MQQKIIFAGTPEIASFCLQALISAGYNIQACLTQPDRPKGRGRTLCASPVKELAIAAGIPVYQPLSLRDKNIITLLQQLAPDLIIVVAYGLIIPKVILDIPKQGCINVHTSLLPRWRGAAPMQHAILAGDKTTGVTIMQMDPGLDTGPILRQQACPIHHETTTAELYQTLTHLGAKILLETLPLLWQKSIVPQAQSELGVTYANKINKADGNINWQQAAVTIDCLIRAFNPWPIAYTYLEQLPIRIWRAKLIAITSAPYKQDLALPGQILHINTSGITVTTGNGELLLTELQLPGKKAMPINELLNSQSALFVTGKQFSHTP